MLASRLGDVDDTEVDTLLNGLTPTPGGQRYRAAYPFVSPNELRETAMSDWLWRMPALHLAEAAHAGGAQVWLYELCWGFGPQGASHALDTLLVSAPPTSTERSRQLARTPWRRLSSCPG